jgi:hypothetical protein
MKIAQELTQRTLLTVRFISFFKFLWIIGVYPPFPFPFPSSLLTYTYTTINRTANFSITSSPFPSSCIFHCGYAAPFKTTSCTVRTFGTKIPVRFSSLSPPLSIATMKATHTRFTEFVILVDLRYRRTTNVLCLEEAHQRKGSPIQDSTGV